MRKLTILLLAVLHVTALRKRNHKRRNNKHRSLNTDTTSTVVTNTAAATSITQTPPALGLYGQPEEDAFKSFIYNKATSSAASTSIAPKIYTYCNTFLAQCHGISTIEKTMLNSWTKRWHEAGWTPIILTIEEVKEHPDFITYYKNFFAKQMKSAQVHMFLRYLAVAHLDGAQWFAESHVLPLHSMLTSETKLAVLPNEGKFTLHDKDTAALMSGTSDQWKNVARIICSDPRGNDWNTFKELSELNFFLTKESVLRASYIIGEDQFKNEICDISKNKVAMRLSSHEMEGLGASLYKWEGIVESYYKIWKAKCENGGKPVMHTFFEPIQSKSTSGSAHLLESWKKVWREAGWEPIVLNMNDLIRHPKHRQVIETFEKSAGKYSMSLYDKMCFYRWFAMSCSGGGWMSDIDSFPLYMPPSKELPNEGKFIGFSKHVPCLVSGSSQEWDRMAWIIVDSYKIHADEFWSDMLALQEIHDALEAFESTKETVEFHSLFDKGIKLSNPYEMVSGDRDRCALTKNMKTIHFSHWSVTQGIDGVGFTNEDYANQENIALKWLYVWKNECFNKDTTAAVENEENNFSVVY